MKTSRHGAGFTLVELVVAASILAMVLGVPLLLLRTSRRVQETHTVRIQLQSIARRTLDRIAQRLEASGTSVIPQAAVPPGMWTTIVDYRPATGWLDGAVVWGPAERIQLADDPADPPDGIDNDRDGLIDEKRVVRILDFGGPGQRTEVLCESVREWLEGEIPGNGLDENGNGLIDEPGFVFTFEGDRVVVWLTLEKRDGSGFRVIHTASRVIAFRN